jgi:hypothetical protein
MSTLNGVPIASAKIFLPAWGVWWADVETSEPDVLSGAATLVVGGQTFVGTIADGGALYGRARYRVAGGAGRWGEEIPATAYNNDLGVKASLVIQDAASLVGETVEAPPADRLGTHYARCDGPASDALNHAARDAWYVDLDGVTRFASRAEFDYAGDGTVRVVDPSLGTVEIATDSVVGIIPGIRAGGITASDVEIEVEPSRIRVRLFTCKITDAWRQLAERLLPQSRYSGTWEYRVVSQSGERLNLQAVRVANGLPNLSRVPVRPGVPGFRATWKKGSFCLVSFVNSDPGRPVVVGGDAPDSPGWVPDELAVRVADMRIDVIESLVKLGLQGDAALDFVALATKVDTAISNIRTAYNSHTHTGVTTGAGSSGTPAVPLTAQSSTAAEHVKAS